MSEHNRRESHGMGLAPAVGIRHWLRRDAVPVFAVDIALGPPEAACDLGVAQDGLPTARRVKLVVNLREVDQIPRLAASVGADPEADCRSA